MLGNKFEKVKTFRPQRGHTLFQVDKETMEISKAVFSTLPMKNKAGKAITNKRIIVDNNYHYISALNETNIKRKLIKLGIAIKIE